MRFDPNLSELRARRYPFLCFFDVSLQVLLSIGILMLGAACLAIILAQNTPQFLNQVLWFGSRFFN